MEAGLSRRTWFLRSAGRTEVVGALGMASSRGDERDGSTSEEEQGNEETGIASWTDGGLGDFPRQRIYERVVGIEKRGRELARRGIPPAYAPRA